MRTYKVPIAFLFGEVVHRKGDCEEGRRLTYARKTVMHGLGEDLRAVPSRAAAFPKCSSRVDWLRESARHAKMRAHAINKDFKRIGRKVFGRAKRHELDRLPSLARKCPARAHPQVLVVCLSPPVVLSGRAIGKPIASPGRCERREKIPCGRIARGTAEERI